MSRAMKDSGVPWLTDIPATWNVERGKAILALQKRPVREEDEVITCFRDGEVVLRSERRTEGFTMSDKEIGYQGINKGDIVIHGMDGFAGAMGVSKSTGKGSPVLVVCTPKYDAVPQFIIYYLRALAMTNVFIALATGIRERSCDLRWNKIAELDFILPPATEQRFIANFLDKKCGEIDEMVSLQEKIIEELRAYKQSVITEAVCKGLNPDVPMKDSGIEGVRVPLQWSARKFNHLCSRITDFVASGSFAALRENVPYLDSPDYAMLVRTADLSNSARSEGRVYISKQSYDFLRNSNLYGGEIVLPNIGSIGDVYIVPKDLYPRMSLAPNAITFSTLQNDKYYYYYFLGALGKKQLRDIAESTAMPKFNKTDLKQLIVLCPPLEEQQDIANYLDTKCAEINALITVRQAKIDALKEYKKSIIYEYITGKKEVNG